MELNRNHYFIIGFLLLFIGTQLRVFDAFVLTEPAFRIVRRQDSPPVRSGLFKPFQSVAAMATPDRTLMPPKWLGWFLLSVGSVLILQSLAMKKPGA